jgi:PAS domain S-box-containing protein
MAPPEVVAPPTLEEVESLLVRSFRAVLAAPAAEVKARGSDALGMISRRLGYGWARLYGLERTTGSVDTLCEWSDTSISASLDPELSPARFGARTFPWLEATLATAGRLQVEVAQLPSVEERRLLERRGVRGLLALGVQGEGGLSGACVFHTATPQGQLPAPVLDAISLACELLAFTLGRREAEARLRVSEGRHRLLAEATGEAVFVHDGTVVLDANQAASRLLGRPREEIVGQPVIGPFLPREEWESVARAIAAGVQGPYQVHTIAADGTRIPLEVEARDFVQEDRRLRVAIARDLRERQRVERALREGEERQRRLLEATYDGIMVSRLRDGRIVEASDGFCRMFGLRPGEAVGRQREEFIAPEERERVRVLTEQNDTVPYEFLGMRANGERFPVEVLGASTAGDDALRTTGVRDVGARRRAEEERSRVDARLQQAQKMESLGLLAGGIAHDFNNLLVGVLGNLDLAHRDLPDGHPARLHVEPARRAASRAAELTAQMLAYAGRGTLKQRALNLSALVADMAQLLSVSLPKKVELLVQTEAGLPAVQGDPTQLRQVAMNLLTNAGEAIGDNVGRVTLETGFIEVDRAWLHGAIVGAEVQPGPFVYLRVVDTGTGMDPATVDRMFDPFFTTKFTGRGLGLAAVLGIVRAHAGALTKCGAGRAGGRASGWPSPPPGWRRRKPPTPPILWAARPPRPASSSWMTRRPSDRWWSGCCSGTGTRCVSPETGMRPRTCSRPSATRSTLSSWT